MPARSASGNTAPELANLAGEFKERARRIALLVRLPFLLRKTQRGRGWDEKVPKGVRPDNKPRLEYPGGCGLPTSGKATRHLGRLLRATPLGQSVAVHSVAIASASDQATVTRSPR